MRRLIIVSFMYQQPFWTKNQKANNLIEKWANKWPDCSLGNKWKDQQTQQKMPNHNHNCKIKIKIIKYCFLYNRLAKIEHLIIPHVGNRSEKLTFSLHYWLGISGTLSWRVVWQYRLKCYIHIFYDSAILILGIYLKAAIAQKLKNICAKMFIEKL